MQKHFTVVDLETTGLNPKIDKIIEIGAIQVEDGRVVRTFEKLVNPGRKLSSKVKEITGITDEELTDAPPIDQVIKEFLEFADDECILGHSILFDYSFLKRAAVNAGKPFERNGIDTLRIARVFLPELESRSLPFLCRHFEIRHNPHRALSDVEATYDLYKRLQALFYEKNPDIFLPKKLIYQVKKDAPVTRRQVEQLKKILEFHGLADAYTSTESEQYVDINRLTKSEASRFIDYLILHFGRCR